MEPVDRAWYASKYLTLLIPSKTNFVSDTSKARLINYTSHCPVGPFSFPL